MAYTTIDNPELYFQTKLYTGNGSSRSITLDGSENMQPDWVWIKSRSNAEPHVAFDSVRGANKEIKPNENFAESTRTTGVTSFDSDGFSIGGLGALNENGYTFVAWNWKAGGSASSNSDGSTTTSISANTSSGFSIVSWTGTGSATTLGHGLNSKPEMIFIKNRDATQNWVVYNSYLSGTEGHKALYLDLNYAETDQTGFFNDTAATSSVFTVGSNGNTNNSGDDFIAYCFHSVKGYSKIGKWTGNGNADGPFVYTGFRPAWILRKEIPNADVWIINDTKRNPINNESIVPLYPHLTNSEPSGVNFDFLSNGFKIRNSDGDSNTLNATFIYMAFAESPFVNSNGVPNNAK